MKTFDGKVVWITGANAGIGEAIAKAFARYNVKLVLSARRETELERVKKECGLPQNAVMVLPLDLLEHDTMPEKVQKVIERFQRIDILVNNGGVSSRFYIKDTPLHVDKQLMNINYFGTVSLTKAVLPQMVKQKSGHIITISSVAGKTGTQMRSAYAASKHALHGFFDSLRAEHYPDNIKVTMACPGYIRTHISLNALNKNGQKYNKMDTNQAGGMHPEVLADKLLKAVAKGKEEVYIGGKEIMGIYLKRFAPAILSRILRKVVAE